MAGRGRPRVYVVTDPPEIRGVYETWPACQAAVSGVPGARYQAVASRADAEAMLRGAGVALAAGAYAFIDGNHEGGVGVVLVEERADGARAVREISTTVRGVFAGAGLPRLGSPAAIRDELGRLRNVLAEIGGLHEALSLVAPGTALTVVHDYEGVGAWMEGRWKTKDAVVAEVVEACRALVRDRRLTVAFRRQRGHQSTWAGRDDFAHFNARADALATRAAGA